MMYYELCLILMYYVLPTCQDSDDHQFLFQGPFTKTVKSKYFIDKSLFIKTFLNDDSKIVCTTAPKLFGKTLNLLMMKHFFEIQVNDSGEEIETKSLTSNYHLFTKLRVYKEQSKFFHEHFGRYPIIFIDFQPLEDSTNYEETLRELRLVILNAFKQHEYLINAKRIWMNDFNLSDFMKYFNRELNRNINEQFIKDSFSYLCNILFAHFKRTPLVLIDGFDSVTNSIVFKNNKDVVKVTQMYNTLQESLFESNKLKKAFCTGTISIFDFPNIKSSVQNNSFAQHHQFTGYYGSTREEIANLLRKYTHDENEIQKLQKDVKNFYNGYTASGGNIQIYNTYSVLKYLQGKRLNYSRALRSYRMKSKFHDSMLCMLYMTDIKEKMIILLNSGNISLELSNFTRPRVLELQVILNTNLGKYLIDEHCVVFNYLFQQGYMTSFSENRLHECTDVRLPNREVQEEVKAILIESVVHQFCSNDDRIDSLNEILNGISETNFQENQLNAVYQNLKILIECSNFAPATRNDFQNDVHLLFSRQFQVVTAIRRSEGHLQRVDIRFMNDRNIMFIVETGVLIKNETIEEQQLVKCVDKLLTFAVKKVNLKDRKQKVICLGICLALPFFGTKPMRKIVWFGYTKYIHPGDDIYCKTVFI